MQLVYIFFIFLKMSFLELGHFGNTLHNSIIQDTCRILESQNHEFVVHSGFEDLENQIHDSGFPWNDFQKFGFRRFGASAFGFSEFSKKIFENSNSISWPVIILWSLYISFDLVWGKMEWWLYDQLLGQEMILPYHIIQNPKLK